MKAEREVLAAAIECLERPAAGRAKKRRRQRSRRRVGSRVERLTTIRIASQPMIKYVKIDGQVGKRPVAVRTNSKTYRPEYCFGLNISLVES